MYCPLRFKFDIDSTFRIAALTIEAVESVDVLEENGTVDTTVEEVSRLVSAVLEKNITVLSTPPLGKAPIE
jgi:hypothetical protein